MRRNAAVLITTMAVAACGGGGGGVSGTGNVLGSPLKIDSGNAMSAAWVSYESANASAGLGQMAGGAGLLAASPGGIAQLTKDHVHGAISQSAQSIPLPPTINPCFVDGTITITGNVQVLGTISPGDTFTVTADQCDEGNGETLHGVMSYTVVSFDGDLLAGLYALGMSMQMMGFQITTADDVFTSNGDATVTLDNRQAPFVTASVTGSSMTTDSNTTSETLTSYASDQTLDAGLVPSPYTWSADGTLSSTQLTGVVDYSTPVTFQGFDTDYPSSGELLVEGDSSSARLIAVDNVNVRIEIDTDGNGEVDETINTTWDALAG